MNTTIGLGFMVAALGCGRLDFAASEPSRIASTVVSASSIEPNSLVTTCATDADGNLYIGGGLSGTADFGSGPVYADTPVNTYAASFAESLRPRWSRAFAQTGHGGAGTSSVSTMALANGTLFVKGPFEGSVDFGGGPIYSAGGDDQFLASLSLATGDQESATRSGGVSDDDLGGGLAIAGDGTRYLGGGCNGDTYDFGGTPLAGSDRDPCVGVVSASGTVAHQRRWVDPGQGGMRALVLDDHALIAAGYFAKGLTLSPFVFTASGSNDAFVARLDDELVPSWAVQLSSEGDDDVVALTRDDDGAVYVAGNGSGAMTIGASSLELSDEEGFLTKLDSAGAVVWARPVGGAARDKLHDSTRHGGSVVVAGEFEGALELDGFTLTSVGDIDAFVAAFDPSSGAARWVVQFGGPLADATTAVCTGGNVIYVAGYTNGGIELGGDAPGLFMVALEAPGD